MYRILMLAALSLFVLKGNASYADRTRTEQGVSSFDFSNCVGNMEEKADVSFDFGDRIVVSASLIQFTATTSFPSEPILELSGNIAMLDSVFWDGAFNFSCQLPQEDGYLRMTFDDGSLKAVKTLYSVKGEDGVYALSCLSKYDAMLSLDEVPGHEYMDNDTIEADDRGATPDFSNASGGPNRVIAGGRVYGYLKWTDDSGRQHPLIGAKVKLTFTGSVGNASTYTNSSGYFNINFSDILTLWAYECDIHVYAENNMGKVTNSSGTVYEYARRLAGMQNGDSFNFGTYVFSIAQNDDLARAMQIFSAIYNYSNYARNLNGGAEIEQCRIIYPVSNDDEGSYYANGRNTIYLGKASQNNDGYPCVHASWDTIGHEYGHHLQYHFFRQNFFGDHYADYNDIYSYFKVKQEESSSYTINSSEIMNAKTQGVGLAWKEAWPTFFAISAQSSFSNDIKSVPTVGDAVYEAYNKVRQNLKVARNEYGHNDNTDGGESDEQILMCFLYRIWEGENTLSFDSISISDSDLWTIMKSYNPENFSSFITDLSSSGLSFSRDSLGKLLEWFRLSSSNISVSVSMGNYHSLPTVYWTANGSNIEFNGTTYNYGNNKFTISFYDSDFDYIGECETMNTSIQISSDLWKNIIAAPGNTYFVRIESYAILGGETGPYFSGYHEFAKPAAAQETISITNSRYYERDIAIAPGTEYTFNVTFDYSGTKLIQTFGTTDVVMSLYEPDGTTLIITSDDEGYGRNSLIYRYLLSDTQYVLKLRVFGNADGGLTRLCIAPIYGAQADSANNMNEFENFVNLNTYHNWSWGSYLATRYSKMITWTVPENGTYKLSLASEFDNYLYVVDPTSPYANVFDVNYNDDDEGTNASITNYYRGGKTYAIFYCQYYPASAIGNGEISADISLSISKIS